MKPFHSFAMLAAIAAVSQAFAVEATTTPVGYETLTLAPQTFNLTGVRLFNSQVAAGTFESFTSTSLTDTQGAFSLEAAASYIVEFPNGATITALGSDFSGTTLSNLTGIDASFVGSYVIRKAATVSTVFGATDSAGLASSPDANATDADLIYLPNGVGGYKRVFYSTFVDSEAPPAEQLTYFGWLDADTFEKASDAVIDPTAGFFVQTAKSVAPLQVVVSGEVKKTSTAFVASNSFSLVGGVYPAGATLTTSGLSAFVLGSASANATEADVILLPDGSGGFVRAFYSTFVDTEAPPANQNDYFGWLSADTFAKIPNQPLTPGFFIQKVGPTIVGVNAAPTFYATL